MMDKFHKRIVKLTSVMLCSLLDFVTLENGTDWGMQVWFGFTWSGLVKCQISEKILILHLSKYGMTCT
jgi:hypothetical protein